MKETEDQKPKLKTTKSVQNVSDLLQKLTTPGRLNSNKTRNISASNTCKKLEVKVPVVDINSRFEHILR